jgi:hypothetical protein
MTNGQDTKPDATESAGPPPNLFWLKALVGGLAAMMAFAMLVIVGRIGYLVFGPDEAPPAGTPIAITLPDTMKVESVDLDNGRLGVVGRAPDGAVAIGIYDVRTGEAIRTFEIKGGGR